MTAIQVHLIGTQIIIENHTIGVVYSKESAPREVYSLDDAWLQAYRACRVCGVQVSEERLAWAYWKHEAPVCSVECLRIESLARYACCEKATQMGCVCAYSITCPDHGEAHFGTHD